MKRPKPTIGQKLIKIHHGFHQKGKPTISEVIVKKIGRKYFTCGNPEKNNEYTDEQYYLSTWEIKSEYSSNTCLYLNQKEWENKIESEELSKEIKQAFDYGCNRYNVALENLRKIIKLIKGEK